MRRKLKARRLFIDSGSETVASIGGGLFVYRRADVKKIELRCGQCRKLLGRVAGSVEIKCSRCGTLNKYDADTNETELIPKAKWADRRW